jgi:Ca2+-binding RTX toxin-like protein
VAVRKWREWLSLCVGLAGLYAAAAQAASVDSTSSVDTRLSGSKGSLSISNSRQGAAILTAEDLAPGDAVTGAVSVLARGTGRGFLTLAASNLSSKGSANLADVLQLRVEDQGGGGAVVFEGPLRNMRHVLLGGIRKGQQRTYRFTASLPEEVGSEYAGASTGADFVWSASALSSRPACAAVFRGSDSAESLTGTLGGDRILAGAGPDVARGLGGRDCIYGQRGSDRLYGGPGSDRIVGGPGRDVIRCGPGFDIAQVDDLDNVAGCESVRRG